MLNPEQSASIFFKRDYKEILREKIRANAKVYGYQTRLAEAANCQKSFLSAVVNGDSNWSLEHAIGASRFWGFDRRETSYFIDLVLYARAGSTALKEHLHERIERRSASNAGKKLTLGTALDGRFIDRYYSAWYYCAVHILLAIPAFQEVTSISVKLKLDPTLTAKVLAELEEMKVIEKHGDLKWKVLIPTVHLPRNQYAVWEKTRTNWHERAMLDLRKETPDSIHYSAVSSLTRKDADKIRRMAFELTERASRIVDNSHDEEIVYLGVTYFTV